MYVVVPLAAKALEQQLTVYACLLAEHISVECVATPALPVVLHPVLHSVVAHEVHLVEVFLALYLFLLVDFYLAGHLTLCLKGCRGMQEMLGKALKFGEDQQHVDQCEAYYPPA